MGARWIAGCRAVRAQEVKHMRLRSFFTATVASAATLLGAPAFAYEGQPNLITSMGIEASIGGGVVGFTEQELTDVTDPGGSWTARLTVGTRSYLAGELAYIGTAQNINSFGLDSNTVLMSNGVEGALRLNLVDRGIWQPFAFVGIAWKRYGLVNEGVNTSSVNDSDNVGEVPVGAGLAFRYEGFVVDARFEFRPTFNNDLMAPVGSDETPLHSWGANARVGWEF
jgi:hypothetical protein